MAALRFFHQWFGPRNAAPPEAIDEGHPEAQFALGLECASAEGTAQNYPQAVAWYRLAAEQNHPRAQFNLALLYRQGRGVGRDEATALMWMARAANLGEAAAQYTLGVQHHLESRDKPNAGSAEARIEALKWVRLSAAQAYRGAASACEFVALGMTREEVAEGGRRVAAFTPVKIN